MSENNPFLALFNAQPPPSTPTTVEREQLPEKTCLQHAGKTAGNKQLSSFLEKVFRFTLQKTRGARLIYLEDLAESLYPQDWLDIATLEQAVFEHLVSGNYSSQNLGCIGYLFECFERTIQLQTKETKDNVDDIMRVISQNVGILLQQPQLIPDQDIAENFLKVVAQNSGLSTLHSFLGKLIDFVKLIDDFDVSLVIDPVLKTLHDKLSKQSLLLFDCSLLEAFSGLCSVPDIAHLILKQSLLSDNPLGRAYESTLLGSLFSISCIPKSGTGPNDYFDKPSKTPLSVHSATEGNLWTSLERLHNGIHKIIYGLLKVSVETRSLTLTWLGKVLATNSGRAQTWTQHSPNVLRGNFVDDGFILNLTAVLLKLCEPLCGKDPKSLERLTKVDPTYCAVDLDPKRGVHLSNMPKETCLIPAPESYSHASSELFTFLTEVFYLTNKAIELGPKVCHERLVEISQNLNKMQRMFQDAQNQNSDVVEQIQNHMDSSMTLYLSYKAALLVPEVMKNRMQFSAAAARWLCSVALKTTPSENIKLNPQHPEEENLVLASVPEFIVSNIADHLTFLRRFNPFALEESPESLKDFLTLIVVFMGAPKRMKNPHLRASLAGMLESLMPHDDQSSFAQSHLLSTINREKIFNEHPHAAEVVPTLLHVFVSIEMTGEGVAFQQKFNYRRPMYIVMKYLWTMQLHRNKFRQLATEAEANMEAANPPLFLRFINLLINDANYLLDEAFSFMAQLKEQQQQRSGGQWPEVPVDQRGQREATFQHLGMLAKFHNVMGLDTIYTLEMLTSEIQSIFVHKTIVDRIAAMLNYFLLHLVGPKKRNFKVKDFQEYEFRPSDLVSSICQIYIHLYKNEAFCLAVFQDSRSYSPQLFTLAEEVLVRIGRATLVADLQQVADRVAALSTQQKADEELAAAAPEEFLDPIMSVVMTDPVILPSSKVTVDRSTIARHLLSDQTDPFNRCPLTMEQVQPDNELRGKIARWIAEQREARK